MVTTRKKNPQHKKQLSQLNETLNDFVIGNNTNSIKTEDQTLEPQANNRSNIFGRTIVGENSACQNQVIENSIDDNISNWVDSAVMTVENWMHDAILTTMDKLVILRVKKM